MEEFIRLADHVWRLEVPFPGCWTGVVLVTGKMNILVDTGGCAEGVDGSIVPALEKLGVSGKSIDCVALTHIHGDHVGGCARLKQLYPGIRFAVFTGSLDRARDPRAYSAEIRAKFPGQSAPVPAVLDGIEPDILLSDGDRLGDLTLLHTPGHDTDSCCYLDDRTGTLITGDSLQLNGTVSQGCALLMDAGGYERTLRRLKSLPINNIVCGHPYLPLGPDALGKENAARYLDACLGCYRHDEGFVAGMAAAGVKDPVAIAEGLIREVGGIRPKYLFLPLYTVTQYMERRHIQ